MRFLFVPISLTLSLLAGLVAKKAFDQAWGLIDDEEPPQPEHRKFAWPKLVAALVIEGAIFRLVKGVTDHGARRSFERVTGFWPGEEAPETE